MCETRHRTGFRCGSHTRRAGAHAALPDQVLRVGILDRSNLGHVVDGPWSTNGVPATNVGVYQGTTPTPLTGQHAI